jgi:tRNA pseudouridine55 synthase
MDGILLVDKPKGKTSHDVVDAVRRDLKERSVGHAGTLDPLATGLLVLGVGKATRLLEYMHYDKTYEAEIELGILTETDDADGARLEERPVPSGAELEAAAAAMVGEITQKPPKYSAIKVEGKKLYEYARKGREVEVPDRRVRVDELTLLSYEPPRAKVRIRGSKGLYVRSIARDLGGHIVELRRTACGPFGVEDAGSELLPADVGLMHLPEVRLTTEELHRFENGRIVERPVEGIVRVYCGPRFVGIGEKAATGGLKPRKVIQS